MLASEFFSAWYMGRNPTHEIIFASYAQDRSDDVGKAVRDIMLSETHEQVFPESKLRIDAKGTRKFQTIQDGTFFTTSWKGATTGRGANCWTKDTVVETADGPMTIEKIHYLTHKPLVLSMSLSDELCYSKVSHSIEHKNATIYELKTISGKVLYGTEDHRIYSQFRGYTQLKDLVVGERLVQNISNIRTETDVVSMAPRLCKNKETVYDIQVEKTHNFFAGGLLVHNCLILDDLIKDREDAQSDVNRRKREEWFSSSGYTRLMSDEGSPEGRILLIMTRWAYDDIAAYLLNQLAHEHWHILNCPAIAEEKDILGRLPGDALWPERYPISRLENVKKSVISTDWTALYQQRPLPKEGGMWKLYWFKEYNTHHLRRIEDLSKDRQELPEELKWFDRIVMSVDTAYKPEQMNDPSCITVWGYSKNRQYLIEVLKEKLEYPELKRWIERTHEKYTEWNMGPVPVLIEDSASGQSLIQDYKVSEYRMPVIKITSIKSKVVRAEHASGYAESGNIVLPERAPWKTDFESEFAQFPFGSHDDQVDSVCQYINWFYKPKKKRKSGKIYVK